MKISKKILTAILASSLVVTFAGFSGGTSEDAYASSETSSSSVDDMLTITFYNTKFELSDKLDAAAEKYAEEFGVNIEFSFPSDDVKNYVETTYTTGNPYTMVMVEATDINEMGSEYGIDLSGEDWIEETDYAYTAGGKVIGFPFCIEAFGIIYNSDAIEAVTGEKFNPSSITFLSDFTDILEQLVRDGMEFPTAIQKVDWSLSHHYLQQAFDERPDIAEAIDRLYKGEANAVDDEKFNALMDTFDVLMQYNLFQESPTKVSDDQVYEAIATGEVAFKFGGCWEWDEYTPYGATENMGIMPVPQDIEDDYTGCLDGGVTKYVFIDNSEYTTDEQRQAALDFLNWLVYSDEGQAFISDECGLVSPFRNNNVPCSNPLSNTVKEYVDDGKVIQTYDSMPSDYQPIMGARMQDYLAGSITRLELALYLEEYWVSATPPEIK